MVKFLWVQQGDHGSLSILHQLIVASFIRRRSLIMQRTETATKVMSSFCLSPPPYRNQHFLCVHQLLCKKNLAAYNLDGGFPR